MRFVCIFPIKFWIHHALDLRANNIGYTKDDLIVNRDRRSHRKPATLINNRWSAIYALHAQTSPHFKFGTAEVKLEERDTRVAKKPTMWYYEYNERTKLIQLGCCFNLLTTVIKVDYHVVVIAHLFIKTHCLKHPRSLDDKLWRCVVTTLFMLIWTMQ